MTAVTESDLQGLKDLITSSFNEVKTEIKEIKTEIKEIKAENAKISQRLGNLEEGQRQIETRLTVIETRLEEWKPSILKISDLTEKVGELKNWKQAGLIIVTAFTTSILSGTIGGVIGWLIRGSRNYPNP